MVMKAEKRSATFKAGLFIIISLALLIFSILWLRYFAILPDIKVVARFDDPGPVSTGISVYYQGVNIGKVSKIKLSDDFSYTLLYIDIYHKKLKLPRNVTAVIRTEGITGQRYISIVYPEEPDNVYLSTTDTIEGQKPFSVGDFQDFLEKEFKEKRMKKFLDNFENILANTNEITLQFEKVSGVISDIVIDHQRDLKNLMSTSPRAVRDFNTAMTNINRITGDPEIQTGVKSTVKTMDNLVKKTDTNVENIFDQIETSQMIPRINYALEEGGSAFSEAKNILQQIRHTGLVSKTFNNINRAAERVDCFTKNLGKSMSKRFLIFRLMFGRPGKSFEECEKIDKKSCKTIYPNGAAPIYLPPVQQPDYPPGY